MLLPLALYCKVCKEYIHVFWECGVWMLLGPLLVLRELSDPAQDELAASAQLERMR